MHANSILEIIMKYDSEKKQQTLITCAKDKKIKVWDWMNKECLVTLSEHSEAITSIVLTKDARQSMLFSGSLDMRVVAWDTTNWV